MTDIQSPIVGAASVADGTESRLRADRTGALRTVQGHGALYDDASRGNSWTVSTPVAGITVTALMVVSTASSIPIVGVLNPAGSGVNLAIQRCYVDQTIGTNMNYMWWGGIANTTMTVANGLTTGISNKGFAASGHAARVFAGATAVVGTPTSYRILPCFLSGAPTAANIAGFADEVDGEIIVAPGSFVGVFGDTTNTTGTCRATLTWTELPI
jgi:hypothetical protein